MKRNKVTKDLESNYKLHSQLFWILFILSGLTFFLIQSFIATPREILPFFWDAILPILISVSGIFLVLRPKNLYLIRMGLFYMFLTIVTFTTDIFPKPYGTFFFLFGTWLLVDYRNYKILGKSIFSELMNGNYRLALGVIISTFLFGIVTEIINLPFLIWEYNIPIPSMKSFGMPALLAAFGWTPWTLAILSIFYSFIAKKESKWVSFFKRKRFKL